MTTPPPASTPPVDIPTSKKILGFTGWNLIGLCAPMLVALVSIPLFLRGLGSEKYGALMLVWMLVGYFGILDLGMGRAMTKLTAEYMGLNRRQLLPNIFWTALMMMIALGLLGAIVLAASSHALVTRILNISPILQPDARTAFLIAAAGLPFTIAVTGLIGILETHQYFRLINLIRVPLGMATYLAPLAVLPFTDRLSAVVAVLIGVRIVEMLVFLFCCLRLIPALRRNIRWDSAMVKPLLTFGGWLTASNITLPLMLHVDRFIVGIARTLTDVAYYANPAEIIVKVLTLPRAWVSAIFPPMTMHLARGSDEADALFARSVKLLLIVLFPAILGLYTIAPEFLRIWLGAEFADHSTAILRILAGGMLVYCMAYLAFSLLQSAGRPGLAARWHLLELLPFLGLATWATSRYGIHGMAWAWSARCVMDALVLFPLALRFVPKARPTIRRCALMTAVALLLLPLTAAVAAVPLRIAAAAAAALLFTAWAWLYLLSNTERTAALDWISARLPHRAA